MKYLKLKCKSLDSLLGGGIENNSITEIYGEAGSGKTNFCIQASRECANIGQKVAYIDSDGVSGERLKQICQDYDYKKILSNILFCSPSSFEKQEKMIDKVTKIKNIGLIVVDTFNRFYRVKLENDEEAANRSLNRQLINLLLASRKNNLYVILTGQVYATEKDDVKPFAGRGIKHMVKTIIKLEKSGVGKRKASIIKHRTKQEGEMTFFTITSKGLE
jgi:DNA repair protein RadB